MPVSSSTMLDGSGVVALTLKLTVPNVPRALPLAPPVLQGKTEAQALAYLKEQKVKRVALQSRIRDLTRQREEMLAQSAPTDSFDEKVVGALMEQARKQGVH